MREGVFGMVADGPADFEAAWGMVDVKRVASLTLRGPTLDAIVKKSVLSYCFGSMES